MSKYISFINGPKKDICLLINSRFADFLPEKCNSINIRYFSATQNWGDTINPIIISRITDKKVITSSLGFPTHILGIGSILSKSTKSSIIWGSGFISENDKLKFQPKKILALRGYLSYKKLIESGLNVKNDIAFGDPGLLAKDFFHISEEKIYDIGIIPHYTEYNILKGLQQYFLVEGIKLINLQKNPYDVFEDISSCKIILSSSLHGLIAADSLSIPNVWVKLSNKIIGGDFKFLDYYSIFQEKDKFPFIVNNFKINTIKKIANRSTTRNNIPSSNNLISALYEGLQYI